MKKLLIVLAAFALMAAQPLTMQATSVKPATRFLEKSPTTAFTLDTASLLNQLTTTFTPEGLWVDAAVDPAQDDTTPPRIGFLPPALYLYPSPGFSDFGAIFGASIDAELPYIVAFGAAAAYGSFNVYATGLDAYFDYVQIQLPSGEIELGIGFLVVAFFEAYYDYYTIVCPCGHLEVFAVDFAGNTAINGALTIALSF